MRKVHLSDLIKEQEAMSKKVRLENGFEKLEFVGAADCAFTEGYIYCAFVILSYEDLELREVKTSRVKADFPYIPGFLSYREKGAYLKAYERLEHLPDVILFDGQGISHYRGLGLASHIGLLLDKPTIGCAKSHLVGEFKMPGRRRSSSAPLIYKGKKVGWVLRTQDGVAPLFVSPGHKVDFATAKEIVLRTAVRYRMPEPLRYAHMIANRLKRDREL